MLEITLLKTLYHEMDCEKIEQVHEFDDERHSKFRELFIDVPEFPDIKTLISEVRYMSYGIAMYYVHFNGQLTVDEDITSDKTNAALITFFKTYRPDFFKEDLPQDISKLHILDCLDVAKLPDYRPEHAFPGLIMLEDIKSGKVKLKDSDMPVYPGLRMLNNERKDNRPSYISDKENFTEFNGNNDDFQKKLDELKKQFDISAMLGNN